MSLWRAINDPYLITRATKVESHLLESRAVQKPCDGDETYDARVEGGIMVKHLPGCPSPEIDIKIAQVLCVCADTPLFRRHPIRQWGSLFCFTFLAFNPAAETFGLFFVGRIAQ